MGKGWLDKYQNGGSLPGASGMMYGRTSSKEPKKAQNGTVERREIVRDNIPQQKQFNIKPLSAEYIAELKRQEQIAKTGELKAYEPQGILDKALDVTLNPMTAFGYAVRGERLPDNFDKGKRNSIDYALDVINPAQYVNDAKNLVEGTVTGNLSQIGEGALGVVPLGLEAKNIYKGVKNFKPKNFKSKIDWENWVKYKEDFHNNPKVIKHLNEIEKSTKVNGTWMKNPDGSAFKGTPEQFVIQQSDNFKKAFPNPILDDAGNIQTNYHGSPNKFDEFKPALNPTDKTGERLGKGIYTTPERTMALEYAVKNQNKRGNLYELYQNANNPQTAIKDIDDYIDNKIEKIKKDFLDKKITGEETQKLYDEVLKENDELWEKIPDSEFKLQKDKDYLRIDDEQVVPFSNYPKSMIGNILLDRTNPNIYKTLIPGAIGVGAASQTEFKNGGWLDKYQDNGKLKKAQNGETLSRDQYLENLDQRVQQNYLFDEIGLGGKTTTYSNDHVSTEGGMNCINGVCQMVETLTDKDFIGGRTNEGNYIGNQTFNSNLEKEGFYNVKLNNDNRYLDRGDILQAARFKHWARGVDANVDKNSSDAYTLIPQHAYLVQSVKKDEQGNPISYTLADNSGEKQIRTKELTQKQFEEQIKYGFGNGFKHYDGYLVNRYDPEYIEQSKSKDNQIDLEKASFAPQYQNTENSIFPKDAKGVSELYPELGEVFNYLNKNYKELGSKSGVPKSTFDKMLKYQIGIAGQETKFGDDLGIDINISNPAILKTARKVKNAFGGSDPYAWTKDYFKYNRNNIQDEFKTLEEFQKSIKDQKSVTNKNELTSVVAEEARKKRIHPKSKGIFQVKELSKTAKKWGLNIDDFEDNPGKQLEASLALMIDNYERLSKQYPDKDEDELIYLAAASHNAPGNTSLPIYANYYGTNRDIDYVNKAETYANALLSNNDLRGKVEAGEEKDLAFFTDKDKLDSITTPTLKRRTPKDPRLETIKTKDATNSQNNKWLNKYQDGGIIEDDRGQWAHPGEITKINSNNITMKGVDYPVLGISDTGDTKMMMPNQDYKFKGNNVTEYPMAQNGKQLQKLDQLTNFTNYNTSQPGGWLDNYN